MPLICCWSWSLIEGGKTCCPGQFVASLAGLLSDPTASSSPDSEQCLYGSILCGKYVFKGSGRENGGILSLNSNQKCLDEHVLPRGGGGGGEQSPLDWKLSSLSKRWLFPKPGRSLLVSYRKDGDWWRVRRQITNPLCSEFLLNERRSSTGSRLVVKVFQS